MDDPVEKALWYIETHFEGELAIDEIAGVAGVSRFHLSRVFALTVGQPIMGYARARRLSQAAQALADGAPDILSVGLGHGYGSHEAFSRAFRDHFNTTPESVRANGTGNLKLTEPLRMKSETKIDLAPPRFVDAPALLIAGMTQRHKYGGDPAIPSQWQRFGAYIGAIPGQVGNVTYGIVTNVDDNDTFDYVCGVEVQSFSDIPKELMTLRVPSRRCAVFTHSGHVSSIPQTIRAVWRDWLPASGHKAAELPFIERYDERFNPRTGEGEVELWLPLAP
jgi:AraC family transcriptional regulator